MKIAVICGSVLLLAIGLTIGIMVSQAQAEPPACAQCYYDNDIYCSMELDNRCPPRFPYAYIEYGACYPGGPFNWSCDIFLGCCLDDDHVLLIKDPEPI